MDRIQPTWGVSFATSGVSALIAGVVWAIMGFVSFLVLILFGLNFPDRDIASFAGGVLALILLGFFVAVPLLIFLTALLYQFFLPLFSSSNWVIKYRRALLSSFIAFVAMLLGLVIDALLIGTSGGLVGLLCSIGAGAWAIREWAEPNLSKGGNIHPTGEAPAFPEEPGPALPEDPHPPEDPIPAGPEPEPAT